MVFMGFVCTCRIFRSVFLSCVTTSFYVIRRSALPHGFLACCPWGRQNAFCTHVCSFGLCLCLSGRIDFGLASVGFLACLCIRILTERGPFLASRTFSHFVRFRRRAAKYYKFLADVFLVFLLFDRFCFSEYFGFCGTFARDDCFRFVSTCFAANLCFFCIHRGRFIVISSASAAFTVRRILPKHRLRCNYSRRHSKQAAENKLCRAGGKKLVAIGDGNKTAVAQMRLSDVSNTENGAKKREEKTIKRAAKRWRDEG